MYDFLEMKDSDRDGIPDYLDSDDDNDGKPDSNDKDDDGDGKMSLILFLILLLCSYDYLQMKAMGLTMTKVLPFPSTM